MTFLSTNDTAFDLDFEYRTDNNCINVPSNVYKDQLTLGWILGFRHAQYLNVDKIAENHNILYLCLYVYYHQV